MRIPTMVSLAKSPEEIRAGMEPIEAMPPAPSYPYGCCISFDDDTISKLGLDGELPAPGDVIEFYASATVTCASKDPATGKCRVELQITDIEPDEAEDSVTEAKERSAGRRQRFYGGTMASYDRDIAAYDDNREAGPRP
jgi:hypothetical protein